MTVSRRSPGLRKYSVPADPSTSKGTYIPTPVTGSNTASKASKYLLGLASLALSATYFYGARYSSPTEFRGSNYALCSPNGANIYTVDPERPHVQCFVVQDGHFVDAGSLREFSISLFPTDVLGNTRTH